jgi:uracil-DNA glycosylase family 4
MLKSHGSSNPTAFIIGDIPLSEDLTTGYALSGATYNQLKNLLADNGLSIENFYLTCLAREKMPNSGHDYLKDKDTVFKAQQFAPQLEYEINTLNPPLLIPLGEIAFNLLTGLKGIRKFRGSILPHKNPRLTNLNIKVLPALGPYPFLFQDPSLKFLTRHDFSKIIKHANHNPIPDSQFRVWVCKDATSLRNFLERSFHNAKLLVFDIETYASIPTCISLCFDGVESVCVPIIDYTMDIDQRALMLEMVAKVLASPIPKVNQNIKYDVKILERFGFTVANVSGDTMLATSVLLSEFPKGLGFLTSIYTELPYFKDEGKEFDPSKDSRDRLYLYNAKDSLSTFQIYEKQMVEIKESSGEKVYDNLMKCFHVYKKMENRGIRIDQEAREKLIAKYDSLFYVNTRKLRTLANDDTLNPLSSVQMNRLVFDHLGYEKSRHVTGTDEESLDYLRNWGRAKNFPGKAKEVLQSIIDCRKLHKVIETCNIPLYPDGRFRGEFNLAGTETGRTSGGKCTDELYAQDEKGKVVKLKLGHSLQTIGKHGFQLDGEIYGRDIRSMFVPSHGYSFVEVDLSQAEARVDAVLSGNFGILEVFDGPIGIHKLTGSWVFNCKPEEIKKNELVLDPLSGSYIERYLFAKTVRHAGERNMKADRLASMMSCDIQVANRILQTFHKYQPEIVQVFHKDITNFVNQNRMLTMPNGRFRHFFGRIDGNTINEAISLYPQAIVSDQTKFVLPRLQEIVPWAHFLIEAHDGILTEVPKGREEEYGAKHKWEVESPIDFRFGSIKRDFQLVIPAEVSVGENWGSLKEIKL